MFFSEVTEVILRTRPSPTHGVGLSTCVLTAALHVSPAVLYAAPFSIDVTVDQRVTLSGRAPSLRAAVEDICWRAGVRLDFYDAADRPLRGTYEKVPLHLLLSRILARESYMAGEVGGGDSHRVTWLRVFGDPAVAAARRSSGDGMPDRGAFEVPASLVRAAFDETLGTAEREAALSALSRQISGDAARLEGFLATDAAVIAAALASYPSAGSVIRQIAAASSDARIRRKLEAVVGHLQSRRSAGP